MLRHAFIDALIAPADQEELLIGAEPACRFLIEALPLRGKQDQAPFGFSVGPDRFHRFEYRSGFQQHALPAPKRPVINAAVPVVGPLPKVVNFDAEHSRLCGFGNDAVREWAGEEFGKDSQDVKGHQRAALSASVFFDDSSSSAIQRFERSAPSSELET